MRVTTLCEKFGLRPVSTTDVATGWVFDREEDRERARKTIDEEKPVLLIGCHPCTFFSNMHELNDAKSKSNRRWHEDFELNPRKAFRHVELWCEHYWAQTKGGRCAFREHP